MILHPSRLWLLLSLLFLAFPVRAQQGEPQLRAAVVWEDGYLAAGREWVRLDAEGRVLSAVPLEQELTALAILDGSLWALDAAGQAVLSLTAQGRVAERLATPARGRLQAMTSDGRMLWAVSEAGEILRSEDGRRWTLLDFNAEYAGFYPRMDFRAVAAGGGAVMVAGLREDGRPALFSSPRGSVWSERDLSYTEQGRPCLLEAVPTALSYDALQDRFFLLCSGGFQLELPGCQHCNRLQTYPADTLYARVPSGFASLLLGSGGWRRIERL